MTYVVQRSFLTSLPCFVRDIISVFQKGGGFQIYASLFGFGSLPSSVSLYRCSRIYFASLFPTNWFSGTRRYSIESSEKNITQKEKFIKMLIGLYAKVYHINSSPYRSLASQSFDSPKHRKKCRYRPCYPKSAKAI